MICSYLIANKEAIKHSRNCAGLRAEELLFHLKINNFNCDLQIYAADTSPSKLDDRTFIHNSHLKLRIFLLLLN